MLGYVVNAININENAGVIDDLQRVLLIGVTIGEMSLECDDGKGLHRYHCSYHTGADFDVDLAHIFYDFSDVICEKI